LRAVARQAALTAGLAAALGLTGNAAPAAAQAERWKVDLYAGRALHDPLAARVGASNLSASLSFGALPQSYFYTSAGAPLSDNAPWWGALGGAIRLPAVGSKLGLDLGGHGFAYRDALLDRLGSGMTMEARGFAGLALGAGARLEGRAGWIQHLTTLAAERTLQGAFETDVRIAAGGALSYAGVARLVQTSDGSFPFGRAELAATHGPIQIWALAERWLAADLTDTGWGTGASLRVGSSDLWAGWSRETSNPLYWNQPRQSWVVGFTRRLGRPSAAPALIMPASRDGLTIIRVSAGAAASRPLSVAGDFNDWQPQPMRATGDQWHAELALGPGVYRYAFVDANGVWFVPESVPGRMDDGMGGHVAVLVVP
jgi:hypothetical protein